MRDPNRIPIVLDALRAAWMANPDLRLGQLILATCPDKAYVCFYREDNVWIEKLTTLMTKD